MNGTTLFQRRCRVVVGTTEVVALDADPSKGLTCRFQVEKTLAPSPNKAELHVFNLTPSRVAAIALVPDVPVQIDAGYEGGSSTLFLGKLRTAQTAKDEQGNIVLSLASGDGELEYRASRVSVSVKKNTPADVVVRDIVKSLGVLEGNLNEAIAQIKANAGQLFTSGYAAHGNAARELTKITRSAGLTWSIQDGKLQFLSLRDALKGEAVLLTPETGLVDAPSVDNKGVMKARMLMAPDVFPGRLVVLKSQFLNGQYRIEKTVHSGDTAGNDWYVDIEGKRY